MRHLARADRAGLLSSAPAVHDGISLDFRFGASLNCYVKVPGGAITRAPLTTLFTFTGDNKSYYMGPAGLLIPSVTNTPRIEYTAAGECKGLLMEFTRTNLGLHSNDGTNAAWTKSNCTAAKTATGPDGVANSATTLTATAGNATCLQAITSASATRAYSIWLKRRTGTGNIDITVDGGTGWTTKTITSSWARYEISQAAVTNPNMGLRIVTSGDAVDFWCSQIESAASATSSIPTTTASVQRAAEVCTRSLGSEYVAATGTVHMHCTASPAQDTNVQYAYSFNDTSVNNRIVAFRVASSNTLRSNMFTAAAGQGALDGAIVSATAFRAGYCWATNDLAFSVNGGAAATDSAATVPAGTTSLNLGHELGSSQFNGHILMFDYWPVRQPNGFLTI